jgi:2-octaprenyl-6-methoxyphenol hydroxylase
MTNDYDVILSGAGVPGMMIAMQLANKGLKTAIIEKAAWQNHNKNKIETGRSVALMQSSCDILEQFGLLSSLVEQGHACSMKALRIVDDSFWPKDTPAPHEEVFTSGELGQDQFGFNIHLDAIIALCRDHLKSANTIDIYDHASIEAIDHNNAGAKSTVTVNGKALQASLIIAADGRDSVVRALSNIDVQTKSSDEVALTCILSHEHHHEEMSTEFHRSSGPFTLVPMPGGYRSSLVWVEKKQNADQFMALDGLALDEALQRRTRGVLGKVECETKLNLWPLISQRALSITAPRVALIAEAAHVFSPIGAQGMNMSLRDGMTLSDIVIEAALNGLDIGSKAVLDRYAVQRRADMVIRPFGIDLFHRGVAHESEILHRIRRGGLRLISSWSPLRRSLMQEGLRVGAVL